jgi:tetratricopeptide (TPR) repeat protein
MHDDTAPHGGDALADLLDQAVRELLDGADFPTLRRLVAGALETPGSRLGAHLPPAVDARAAATELALQIWNHYPDPGHRFRPRSLDPERNEPCLCGADEKYKRCCGRVSLPRLVASEDLWVPLLGLKPELVFDAAESGAIPRRLLAGLASSLAEHEEAEAAFHLLDTALSERAEKLDADDEEALSLWLELLPLAVEDGDEAIDRLATLTERLPAQPRAVVFRHLAAIDADAGLHEEAASQFEEARRLDPRHPSLGPLDVSLAAAAGDWEEAAERAAGWVARYRAAGFAADESPVLLLDSASRDPRAALALGPESERDRGHERLLAWVRSLEQRAVPHLEIRPLTDAESATDDAASGLAPHRIEHSAATEATLAAWRALLPARSEDEEETSDAWEEGLADRWLGFLETRPEAADCPEILLDVLHAVGAAEELANRWAIEILALPLAERGTEMLSHPLAHAGELVLPWGHPANRAAVEVALVRLEALEELGRHDEAHAAFDRLKQLAPDLPMESLHEHDHDDDHAHDHDDDGDDEDEEPPAGGAPVPRG